MPTRSAGDIVRAHLDAFSAHDLPAMLATMAPDAVFTSGTTLVPPAEFDEFFGWAMRELDPTMQITTLVVDGANVACEFVESVTIDGARRHHQRAAFYTVHADVITSAKVYDERD